MPSDLLDEVNITRFTKAQGEEIRTFLLSDFHKTEPLNATLEVPPQDVLEFYKKLAGWCEEDISYVARDKGGSIVGIGLACFLDRLSGDNTSLNEPTERYSDKVEKIRCFINTLEDKLFEKLGYEHLMELSHAEWKDEDGQRVFSCKDGTKKAVLYYKRF